jgi:hypothetical protein
MTFDLQRILESKRALRQKLASRPVKEKLAMLDTLRDRARAIRGAALGKRSVVPSEPASESPADAKRGAENTQDY